MDPLDMSLGKAALNDLTQDISLPSEAEGMIAAWNGGKRNYDNGETPRSLYTEDDHALHGHTGGTDAEYRAQVRKQPCMLQRHFLADLAHI